MRDVRDLERAVWDLDRRGYPAYKGLRGAYDFGDFALSIDHVQGDPFAAPSKVSAWIDHRDAGFARELFETPWRRVAFEDRLVRCLAHAFSRASFKVGGSGKSGLVATSRPGPEVLQRSACTCDDAGIALRFEVGLPAYGRSCAAREAADLLLDAVPRALRSVLLCNEASARDARAAAELADDQHALRAELERLGLVAFVANGSVLPRESGVSSRPLKGARPFVSPASLRVEVDLPHRGRVAGMGVARGVTLIVGGGYHGKSTLLKAIESGVYDHVAGDGRELVACDATAVKLRAEDGRPVHGVDVSPFICNLPNGVDTRSFSTADASGSTSQAAAAVEALEAGCRAFLIDEDTSATNFMVRDALMAQVVSAQQEPITPFSARVRELYEQAGVSTVLVAGSSGAFFGVADTMIQMDCYEARDVTERAKAVAASVQGDVALAPSCRPAVDFVACAFGEGRYLQTGDAAARRTRDTRRHGRSGAGRETRLKAKSHGLGSIEAGSFSADLRLVEQLADSEQTAALAQMVRSALERDLFATCTVREVADLLIEEASRDGLGAFCSFGEPACGLALPRLQELCACLNRLRW